MKQIYLKIPNIDELHYRKKWLMDPKTMSYNAGYDKGPIGYHKETGTIEKTDDMLKDWYSTWNKDSSKYYAYICVEELEEPIGEIYYYLKNGIHSMGILIQDQYRGNGYSYYALLELEKQAFEKNKINELSDYIPIDRIGAIKTFQKAGFQCTEKEEIDYVFGNRSVSKEFLITKEMYNEKRDKNV